ncbi:zinc homeostasis factor 1-like isoform X1 [Vespa mandarinia]|uniref:zinc homeostasis factor 1-like isoform X1 n=2 Tax=Vespa mandarinia TaxID=7446 RepID=UPI00161B172E|nr:zinc homeostasis factor 1-like isoform X1 [Vespa mandarinia]
MTPEDTGKIVSMSKEVHIREVHMDLAPFYRFSDGQLNLLRVMPVKEWFRKLQPVQLYLVVFFTVAFFIIEMVASHVTHSLTLLLNAYHMLCNIIATLGCLVSIKYAPRESYRSVYNSTSSSFGDSVICLDGQEHGSNTSLSTKTKQSRSDRRMKNSFGWARIDILTMLICCILLASFCFSLVVEALQTLVHIDHLDEMHHPMAVLCIGVAGIFLNIFCYILIGGFTFNQGILLHVTNNGDVIFRRNIKSQPETEGEQRLAAQTRSSLVVPRSQGFRRICRDVLGCIFVMLVSILVYFTDSDVAKYLDPVFAIISSISLLVLSYPYMKESGLILLQTIPNHINIDSLKKELLEAFPGIVNVHDFHVWQLTSQKIILTVHIIFLDPMVYASIIDQITAFFIEMGITQVTIQPEFHKMKPTTDKTDCLIRCHGELCSLSQCCTREKLGQKSSSEESLKHVHVINKKFEKKEIIPASPMIDLKKFVIHDDESPKLASPTTSELNNSEPCQSNDEQVQSKKDNVDDKSSYSVSVVVNDEKHVANDSSHDTVP